MNARGVPLETSFAFRTNFSISLSFRYGTTPIMPPKKSHKFRSKTKIKQRSWYQIYKTPRNTKHRRLWRKRMDCVLFGMFDFEWNDLRILSLHPVKPEGSKLNETKHSNQNTFRSDTDRTWPHFFDIFDTNFHFPHTNQTSHKIKIGSIFCRIRILYFFRSTIRFEYETLRNLLCAIFTKL